MKYQTIFLFFLVFLATFSIRVYWFSQKDGLFVDEALSITFSSNNGYLWSKNYEYNRGYSGSELKKITLGTGNTQRTLFQEIIDLRNDSKDPVHTNYYFTLLRVFLSGEKSGSVNAIIVRAGILNLLLFSFSFFLFFFFLKSIFKNNIVSLVGCFCVFVTPSTVSSTLFFREYQLQGSMLLLILFVFYYFRNIKYQIKSANINSLFFILFSFCCSLFLLSGYFSIVFISLLFLYIILDRQHNDLFGNNIIYIILLAIVFISLIYPRYLLFILSSALSLIKIGGFEESVPLLIPEEAFFTKILNSFILLTKMIYNQFLSIWGLIIVLFNIIYLLVLKIRIHFNREVLWISVIAFVSMIIIMAFAPFKTMRYVMAFFPLLILFPILFLSSIKKRVPLLIFSVLYCLSFSVNVFNGERLDNKYHRIDNVLNNGKSLYQFTNEEDIPVLIYNLNSWEYGGLIPYLSDNQTYIFVDDLSLKQDVIPDKFFLLASESSVGVDFKYFRFEGYEIVAEHNEATRFYCIKMQRNSL
ncbi:MAG: hypothetical protein JXB49_08995 [Bacteroidales bacterium]|nr:hypothetical protein [Bacteroidales bacterium]